MSVVRYFLWILFSLLMNACAPPATPSLAPVMDVSTFEPIPKNHIHHVTIDETLYSIAWRYGLDYRDLARLNHLNPPYAIQIGQAIYLTQSASVKNPHYLTPSTIQHPIKFVKKLPAASDLANKEPVSPVATWIWPTKGKVIGYFGTFNKGINIGGSFNQPIYATAFGKVVYSGRGLRTYGNLIIIKHNSTFLTAYAHNSQLLVKEGQWVKKGQKIALMGNTGAKCIMLHFEIRRNGKPVNPLNYLSK